MPSTIKKVPANHTITNTAITLRTGQAVQLTASGEWNIYADPKRTCGPGGSGVLAKNGGPRGNWPQAGISEGCLLVYLNGMVVAHFTEPETILITGPGLLGFGPNDNFVSDNTGTIEVEIQIESGTGGDTPT